MSRASLAARAARSGIARTALLSVAATAAAGGQAMAAGMPQFQFNNPLTTGQVFWGAVIFLLLYLLLSRSALPRVASVLAERSRRIDGDLDAAKSARDEAGRATDALRRTRRDAGAEAAGLIEAVMAEARTRAAQQAAEMNARLEAEIERAEAEVAASRRAALASLRPVATDTAQLLVERLTGSPASPARVAATVDGLLAARPA